MNWLVIPFALLMVGGLTWFRSGYGGEIGRRIRFSDRLAWKDAVNDMERDLAALKAAEPKQP